MKTVTTVTEKTISNMVKNNMEFGQELNYILDTLKGRYGCLGATIKEMKGWNIEIENADQISVYITNKLRGMGVVFSEYVTVVDCLDLHHITIKDFNGLVKECSKRGR